MTDPPPTMDGLFRATALRHPDALAVEVGDDTVTYRENGQMVHIGRLDDTTTLRALHTGEPTTAEELTAAAARRLPGYMVPASVHHVPTLPVNAGGKLGRGRIAAEPGSSQDGK